MRVHGFVLVTQDSSDHEINVKEVLQYQNMASRFVIIYQTTIQLKYILFWEVFNEIIEFQ